MTDYEKRLTSVSGRYFENAGDMNSVECVTVEDALAIMREMRGEWTRCGDELPPLGECIQYGFFDEDTGGWECYVENVASHERPDDWYWRVIDSPPPPFTKPNEEG